MHPFRIGLAFFLAGLQVAISQTEPATPMGATDSVPATVPAAASSAPSSASPLAPEAAEPALVDAPAPLTPVGKRAVVIPVEEQVDFGLYAYLKRAVEEAKAEKPDVIVFQVNTFGGELHSAFEIVDLITGIDFCSTYVFVDQKAISAGALISLACNRMAMGEATTIGDCAPITQSQEGGIVMLGEKIQSPLRAKFRNLAEKNGYPSLLSESMVTMDLGVVEAQPKDSTQEARHFSVKQWELLSEADKAAFSGHTYLVQQGQLLTMTDQEAQRYGFSQGSFKDIDAFLEHKGWTRIKTFATNWSEDLARTLGKFAPILMMLGFGALYLEFKSPGFGIFGVLGLAFLAIAFGSKYAVGLADHTELLILLAGFALFMVEIYLIPGTFIAGGIGLLLMVAALVLSLQDFVIPDPEMPWETDALIDNLAITLGMAVAAMAIPILATKYLLPALPRRVQVILPDTLADARSQAPEALILTAGMRGKAKTGMRPSGKAVFEGKTYEVSAEGPFIEAGSAVEVVRVEGDRVRVRSLPEIAA